MIRIVLRAAAVVAAFLGVLAGTASPLCAEPAAPSAPGGGAAVARTTRWTLDDVVRIAIANHPRVGQADAETRAAAARAGQSRSAYYPQADVSAGAARARTPGSAAGDSGFAEGAVSQLVTDFGRTGAGVRSAQALQAAARETGRGIRSEVAFQVKTSFFNVLRAQKILDVRRETVRQRESLLRQAAAFYEAGIRARIDVARAEANLFQARADLTSAENDFRLAKIDLLNRMGIDAPADYELAETPGDEPPPGTIDDWIREAEENRPELRALLERERAAEQALAAARAGYAPVVTAGGAYGYSGSDLPLAETYSLSVRLSVPLFTGFLVRERVAEAEAQRASAAFAVADFRRLVRLEVERAVLAVREAKERHAARLKENEAFAENLRLAAARYEVGAGDIIEMIDAQVQKTLSDTNTINARYDQSVALAALLRAVGR